MPNGKDIWRSALANLNVDEAHGRRAKHQPILLLLVIERCATGGPNRFPYRQIEQRLRILIDKFVESENNASHLPYWHLSTDSKGGLWIIQDKDQFELKKNSKTVKVTSLREKGAEAYLDHSAWRAIQDPSFRGEMIDEIITQYWPEGGSVATDVRNSFNFPHPAPWGDTPPTDVTGRPKRSTCRAA